jgi:hypothetical protein
MEIQVWNVATCVCEVRLSGSERTRAVMLLPDGRIAEAFKIVHTN